MANQYHDQAWVQKWQAATQNVGDGMNYQQAAARLRQLINTKLLTLTDIQDDPERFFEAHRLVAQNSYMGKKTVGNDLDNALLTFKNFKVPRETLLARYVTVDANGKVSFPQGSMRTMDMIGQRLFSGRIAVAQAGLTFAEGLFATTRQFASGKKCWAPGGDTTLIKVPQISAIFKKADAELALLNRFIQKVEEQLCGYLRKRKVPDVALQQAIAVVKVKCIEGAIDLCHSLKQEVGSYALMAGTGFEQLDFLICCKFAEGDSRILMQKMARDILTAGPTTALEKDALNKLKASIGKELKAGRGKKDAWDNSYLLVYGLAEAHMQGVMEKTLKGVSKL
ncbi:hypothetical protein BC833DRAFT_654394 [Globomyces pollinis-pini]|nr:hypothetical protein BC833DRAFT_654394 [Globomyces pollinis-pini]